MNNYKVNEIIEGTIISIRQFGAILIFEDGQKGLLHISQIADSFIRNIQGYLKVGKTYQVKILEIAEDGFLKVSISKITPEEKEEWKKQLAKRKPIDQQYVDFTALRNRLPDWIKKENGEK